MNDPMDELGIVREGSIDGMDGPETDASDHNPVAPDSLDSDDKKDDLSLKEEKELEGDKEDEDDTE